MLDKAIGAAVKQISTQARQYAKTIRQLYSGLRLRLLLLVLLACAPLVGLTLHTASEERRRLVKEWNQRSQEMMELATREEGRVIGQTRQLLLALAESSQVRSGNRRGCKKLLDELFGSYSRYANLGVVGTNGMVLASARPMTEPANQTNCPFFRRTLATRAFAIGDFPDGTAAGQPTVNFGYPVFDSDRAGPGGGLCRAGFGLGQPFRVRAAGAIAQRSDVDRDRPHRKNSGSLSLAGKMDRPAFPGKIAFKNCLQSEITAWWRRCLRTEFPVIMYSPPCAASSFPATWSPFSAASPGRFSLPKRTAG